MVEAAYINSVLEEKNKLSLRINNNGTFCK